MGNNDILKALHNIRHSMLSRVHDDGNPRELYDIELHMLDLLITAIEAADWSLAHTVGQKLGN